MRLYFSTYPFTGVKNKYNIHVYKLFVSSQRVLPNGIGGLCIYGKPCLLTVMAALCL